MLCKKPFWKGVLQLPCGQCLPCRIDRRRVWTSRMILESKHHKQSAFVTLTYADENLPENGTLVPKHVTDWLKRMRRGFPEPLRFFYVGEYGDENERPHYHVALFGYPPCPYPDTKKYLRRYLKQNCQCSACRFVSEKWLFGMSDVATLEKDSIQYVAKYTTKKMTNGKDPYVQDYLKGRHPEFARMSLKPGIGAPTVEKLVKHLGPDYEGSVYKFNGVQWPFGRYIRGKIYESLGIRRVSLGDLKNYVQAKKYYSELFEKVPQLQRYNALVETKVSFKKFVKDENFQKILNLEVQFKMKEGKL